MKSPSGGYFTEIKKLGFGILRVGILRIVSGHCEGFRDRQEAGRLLGNQLGDCRGKNAVVLGIPRGGILIAHEIAEQLQADLDIVIARKLRAPDQPELAVGSVAEDGTVFYNEDILHSLGISRSSLEREKEIQMVEISKRREMIRAVLPKIDIKGRIAIITDDGIATGATVQAALWAVRREEPSYLIVAIPVGPEDAINILSKDADETVCLCTPFDFGAVGQFYGDFDQIDDREVLKILGDEKGRRSAAQS